MSLLFYLDLFGEALTVYKVKFVAAQIKVVDEPNDEGVMFTYPGKLSDSFPRSSANEKAARVAIGGAYPPDLINCKACHNVEQEIEERKLMSNRILSHTWMAGDL
ncbi:hypothetical protein Nepgr_016863 [Nepenthes gracilis]|uniref:Uncharacterized protein n=1 Tax=Nepenthes gracilis TaxID=150966 RepID=A0AAD3SQ38_NEPGR|nr:hypothetical protein Nepgr_016863 [Nepenthes gracilis]